MTSLEALSHTRRADNGEVKAMAKSELKCMAEALYHEARGETFEGILAVKKVILNRVDDRRWPNTVCGVVYQPMQFSFANGGKPAVTDIMAWEGAVRIANRKSSGRFYMATHYFNPRAAMPSWARKLTFIQTIGNHDFYR